MPPAMSSRVAPSSLSSQRGTFLPYEHRSVQPRVVAGGPARTSVVAGAGQVGSRQVGRPQHFPVAEVLIRVPDGVATEVGSPHVSMRQIGIHEHGYLQVGPAEDGPPQVDAKEGRAP